MTVSREATLRAKRVLGSKILCVVNVYGLEEGLHASRDSPDYVEDDQDYLDFLTDSLDVFGCDVPVQGGLKFANRSFVEVILDNVVIEDVAMVVLIQLHVFLTH